ncbi:MULTISPECIES: glycosyltransferase [unclassified Psychrobacter]|uniref:glycosyltransferase n=1 Tax=unclassified Psychrobacter TaxID=196806 RepID=UPI00071E8EC7|nr:MULTISPECIES: glycosyltransferase [unclassified Psychrobacter]OLF36413.1 glycosyl transferase [Psychrobacter sp. Cmf 22.2]
MPKKIVHVIIGLNVGGAELMLKRLVLHSQKTGKFQHVVISLTDSGVIGPDLENQGIKVYSLGMTSTPSVPKTFFKLKKLLKELKPDVVQTWMYHADFLGGLAAKSVGIDNIIWGIRTTDVSQGASKQTVYLSKVCAKLSYYVPNSIVCAAHVSKNYHIGIGYDKSKMMVIPNGFDIEALSSTKEDGLNIRKEIGLSADDTVIGSVGRFNLVKNQKLFIDVAANLVKDFPDLKFMLVGRDNNAENTELMSWITQHDLADNFKLLGQRDDVPKCLKAMDIFCLHSKTEGFPNVVGEAILADTTCVAADVGDVGVLLDKESIALSNNVVGISHAIKNYLSYSKSALIEKADKNKRNVIDKYSIKNVVNNFHELYSKDKN